MSNGFNSISASPHQREDSGSILGPEHWHLIIQPSTKFSNVNMGGKNVSLS